jgi:hypothetical protein
MLDAEKGCGNAHYTCKLKAQAESSKSLDKIDYIGVGCELRENDAQG